MRGWHPPDRPGTCPEGSFFLYVCATLPASPARPASHLQRVVAPRGECRARSGRPARPVLYIHTLRLSPLGACRPAGASGGWAGGLVGGGAPRRVVVEVVDDGGVEWYVWCGWWGRGQRRDWRRRRRLAQAAAGLPLGGAAPGELSAAVRPLARRHTPSDVDGVGVWVQEGRVGCRFSLGVAALTLPPPRQSRLAVRCQGARLGVGEMGACTLRRGAASRGMPLPSHRPRHRGTWGGRLTPCEAPSRGGATPSPHLPGPRQPRGVVQPLALLTGGGGAAGHRSAWGPVVGSLKKGTAHHRHDPSSITHLALLLCCIGGESVVRPPHTPPSPLDVRRWLPPTLHPLPLLPVTT